MNDNLCHDCSSHDVFKKKIIIKHVELIIAILAFLQSSAVHAMQHLSFGQSVSSKTVNDKKQLTNDKNGCTPLSQNCWHFVGWCHISSHILLIVSFVRTYHGFDVLSSLVIPAWKPVASTIKLLTSDLILSSLNVMNKI